MECKNCMDCTVCPEIKEIEDRFSLVLERVNGRIIDNNSEILWSESSVRFLCLLSHEVVGTIFSKGKIKDFIWFGEPISESSLLQVVHLVRRNLYGGNLEIINVRGLGYALINKEGLVNVSAN
ncbi:hypothetical protein [Vibrio agarivorans]|uniref:hypothetical protein n=1 Tax=Vibrio agarivorans TaxID=153622 RepID=UPI0025B60FCC|nr:hypothetical protein [Vibrio agarivorans]MDN3660450.1 hypothetical protein [Vibrio agarivorans]